MPIEPESGSLPQTGVDKVKKPYKGPLKAGTGFQHKDEGRLMLATELVKAGKTVPQAMREAGYSPNTVRQSKQYPVKQALAKVRDTYLMAYVRQIKKSKLDGKSVCKRLGEVVHKNDDYNAVQAIKAHTMILLKNAPSQEEGQPFVGVFVVPNSINVENWQNEAKTIQTVQVETLIGTPQTVNP